mgnify:CR=1 FL=1
MQTGEESSVQWDIPERSSILKRLTCFSQAKQEKSRSLTAVDYSEAEATKILSETEVTAIADVKMGDKTATAWGCDLTHGYIEINADYRS